MAENEERAMARHITANISNQLMLKALSELIGQMVSDDLDKIPGEHQARLLDTAAAMRLAPMPAPREQLVRKFLQENIGTLLTNKRPK